MAGLSLSESYLCSGSFPTSMAPFHLTIVRPDGYRHSDCFFEVVEGLHYALRELGHTVTFAENRVELNATTILFGAHLLSEAQAASLPELIVLYNLEQLGHSYTPPWYMRMASRVRIWDFAAAHLPMWNAVPCVAPPQLVQIGYVPPLSRIASATEQDIDVLFYGSITERRKRALDALRASGVRVEAVFGVYGARRDALIARSKLVLNLHAAESQMFEIVRVSYLLANSKAVVSEASTDTGPLADAVASCTWETVVPVCQRLLRSQQERQELELRAFRLFSAQKQVEILARVVGRAHRAHPGNPAGAYQVKSRVE